MRAYTNSAAYRRDLERALAVRDSDIDYSDIPEFTDEELERMVRARAARLKKLKQPVSIRLDPDVLQWLKREGSGYQTRINKLLREAMQRTEQAVQLLIPTSRLGYAVTKYKSVSGSAAHARNPKPQRSNRRRQN
jgi:uncharacterized protein (DUF4415 family)